MKRNKNIFICITGIDGSGKSTQAKNLKEELFLNGTSSTYVYARSVPIIFKPFLVAANFLFLRNKNVISDYDGYSDTKKSILKKHTYLSKIFYNIMLFDYYLQLIYKIRLPLLLNKNVICDRYIYDTIITDIAVDMNYSDEDIFNLVEKWLSILPTPDIVFLIDLTEKVALSRKNDIPAIGYLKDRRNYYLKIADKYDMRVINGEESIEDVGKIILGEALIKLENIK